MPEVAEIVILSQYLLTKLENRILEKMQIISGKYMRNKIKNIDLLDGTNKYIIKNIDTKGKLMWIELVNQKTNKSIYLTSHLGLTGFWSFQSSNSDRIKIIIGNVDDNKKYTLYYEDDRNFGNINILLTKQDLQTKLNNLAQDSLKTDFTENDFKNYITQKRTNKNIVHVLMDQKAIVSGLGNYLVAEILYHAKISPFRTLGSLSNLDLKKLVFAIKYITKLSYYNNSTGYMTHYDKFIDIHKKRIDDDIYPNYHADIKLKKNDKFTFKVYRQKKDPFGNSVSIDKTIQKNRSTYWVANVQK